MKMNRLFLVGLFALGLVAVTTSGCESPYSEPLATASMALDVMAGEGCTPLLAGQYIEAGSVCVAVEGDALVVTYEIVDGWTLTEAHLWLGESLDTLPTNRAGNPMIGQFPYASGDLSGATSYSFTIPLDDLGGEEYLCDRTLLAASHAAVEKDNGDGTFQTETGWGAGDPLVDKGSWATYHSFTFTCDEDPEDPDVGDGCETAFAFGDTTLIDLGVSQKWGWELTVTEDGSFSTPIYAGAGQNDLTKGTYVGELEYDVAFPSVEVRFVMADGFAMDETHLYVGSTEITTGAPGQFGALHDLDDAVEDSYSLTVDGEGFPLFIVAHAVVCGF